MKICIDGATISANDIISVCAFIISIVAIGVSLWQAHIARKHNRLSVKPLLVNSFLLDKHQIFLRISNAGLGPAIITEFEFFYKDKSYVGTQEYDELSDKLKLSGLTGVFNYSFIRNGYILLPNQSIDIMQVDVGNSDAYLAWRDEFQIMMNAITFDISYKSIYNEVSKDKKNKFT